jgi:hypothetical protein
VLEEPPQRLIIRCAEIRLISAISFPYRYATAVAAAAEAGRRQIFLLAFHAFDDHFDLPQTFCIKTNTRLTETLSQCMCVSLSPSVRGNNNEARARSSDPQLLSAARGLPAFFVCASGASRVAGMQLARLACAAVAYINAVAPGGSFGRANWGNNSPRRFF